MIPLIKESNLWVTVEIEDNDSPRTFLTKRLVRKEIFPDKQLLINTISGAVDLFENREWEKIKNSAHSRDFSSLDKGLYFFLVRRGYLYFDEEERRRFFRIFDEVL